MGVLGGSTCYYNLRKRYKYHICWIVAYRVWGYAVVRMDGFAGLRSCRFAAMRQGDGRAQYYLE